MSFHVGPTIEVGELSLTVIEERDVERHSLERGLFVHASKRPYAVIIRKATGVHAIGMDGTPVPTTELVEKVPELGEFEVR